MECQSGLSEKDLTAHAIPPQHIAPGPGRLLAQEGDRAGAVSCCWEIPVCAQAWPPPCASAMAGRPHHVCTGPAEGVMSSFSYEGKESEGFLQSVGVRNCIWQVPIASPALSAELAAGNFSSNAAFIHGIKKN